MTVRSAQALWNGTLREGDGKVRGESGFFDVPYSFGSRFEEAKGSNPEELIAAAHAGCFSMFLSAQLTKEGHPPTRIQTTAKVHLEAGPTITRIELETEGVVPGIDDRPASRCRWRLGDRLHAWPPASGRAALLIVSPS